MDAVQTAAFLESAVRHICDNFPKRHVWNMPHLEGCRDWLKHRVVEMGYALNKDTGFTAKFWTDPHGTQATEWVENLLITIPGTDPNAKHLIIGAHYDSRCGMAEQQSKAPAFHPLSLEPGDDGYEYQDTPGANDNASAVAALLWLLEELRGKQLQRTLIVAFWVNEEYPFYRNYWKKGRKKKGVKFTADGLGSFQHAETVTPETVLGTIALDTIGCYDDGRGYASKDAPLWKRLAVGSLFPDEHDFVAFLTDAKYLSFTRDAAGFFRQTPDTPRLVVKGIPGAKLIDQGWSDDWSFWERGIPAFCITDTAYIRSQNYHRITDTPEYLNYPVFANVAQGIKSTVLGLCG
jgi:hypothetical protein